MAAWRWVKKSGSSRCAALGAWGHFLRDLGQVKGWKYGVLKVALVVEVVGILGSLKKPGSALRSVQVSKGNAMMILMMMMAVGKQDCYSFFARLSHEQQLEAQKPKQNQKQSQYTNSGTACNSRRRRVRRQADRFGRFAAGGIEDWVWVSQWGYPEASGIPKA